MTFDQDSNENRESDAAPPSRRGAAAAALARMLLLAMIPTGIMFGGFAANNVMKPQTALVSWLILTLYALVLSALFLRRQDLRRRRLVRRIEQQSAEAAEQDIAAAVERLGSDLEQAQARKQAGEAALRAILDSIDRPVLTFDRRRRIEFMNLAAKDLFGTGLEGRDFASALRNPEVLAAVDKTVADRVSRDAEFQVYAPVRQRFRVRIDALPSRLASLQGFVAMIDNITDSRRVQEMRSGFVADVSHELRTPLASILSIVETLQGPARGDEVARDRFLDILREQTERMARLVDDLLHLSSIELREHQPPSGAADLADVLTGVVKGSELAAEGRDMTLHLDCPSALPVPGDRDELVRLFQNLVDNAIKYGDRGTEVTVVASRTGPAQARVSVRDRGAGIAREHIPRLTERFYRTDRARSRAAGGTGLGLAIVKHIVSRHRGELKITSSEGVGSDFSVLLPASPTVENDNESNELQALKENVIND